jgi:hypothetical protein
MSTDNLSKQIASHFKQLFFGGNWTSVDFTTTLKDIDWMMATAKIKDFNSIAQLVFHVDYYIDVTLKVLQGGPLDAHDKFSFDCPNITSESDWENLKNKLFSDAELYVSLVEQLPESKYAEVFCLEKFGNYYRNIHGLIEHSHYHLGQIVLIKKLV